MINLDSKNNTLSSVWNNDERRDNVVTSYWLWGYYENLLSSMPRYFLPELIVRIDRGNGRRFKKDFYKGIDELNDKS
jgi:hypothetical protein